MVMKNNWKILIVVLYLVCAVAAGVVFSNGVFTVDNAAEKKAAEEQSALQAKLDEANVKLEEAERNITDLENAKSDLVKQVNELESAAAEAEAKAEEEAKKAEEEAKAQEEAKAEEEKAKEEAKAKEDAEAEEEEEAGPFYKYKIITNSGPLRLYNKKSGGSATGRAPKGYVGYVIDKGKDSENRALILYKGGVYYASKSLMKISEKKPDKYTSKVAKLSADNIGEKVFKGKAIGFEKKKNK